MPPTTSTTTTWDSVPCDPVNGKLVSDYQKYIFNGFYARWLPDKQRRETWREAVDRCTNFLFNAPKVKDKLTLEDQVAIRNAIFQCKVMPSMRVMMTAGPALARENLCAYNCSAAPIDSLQAVAEGMYIGMCGGGFGFSTEHVFIDQIPPVNAPSENESKVHGKKLGPANTKVAESFVRLEDHGLHIRRLTKALTPEVEEFEGASDNPKAQEERRRQDRIERDEEKNSEREKRMKALNSVPERFSLLFHRIKMHLMHYMEMNVEKASEDAMGIIRKAVNGYVVGDSREGWYTAYRDHLLLLSCGVVADFCFDDIRPEGAPLVTMGGFASGPAPLIKLFKFATQMFEVANGRQLNELELHSLCCMTGSVVIAGGVRRTALIGISDLDSDLMRNAKSGNWRAENSHFEYANNSAAYNKKPSREEWDKELLAIKNSYSGERGIFNRTSIWREVEESGRRTMQKDQYYYLTNPCGEIWLRQRGLCNLTEVIIRADLTREQIAERTRIATILGCIQATLTDFTDIISPHWRRNAEEESLLGVSQTGIYSHPILSQHKGEKGKQNVEWLKGFRQLSHEVADKYCDLFGITRSAAITCVKPSGTVSKLCDCPSGIHPSHSNYMISTVRVQKMNPIFAFMRDAGFYWEDVKNQKLPDGSYIQWNWDKELEHLQEINNYCEESEKMVSDGSGVRRVILRDKKTGKSTERLIRGKLAIEQQQLLEQVQEARDRSNTLRKDYLNLKITKPEDIPRKVGWASYVVKNNSEDMEQETPEERQAIKEKFDAKVEEAKKAYETAKEDYATKKSKWIESTTKGIAVFYFPRKFDGFTRDDLEGPIDHLELWKLYRKHYCDHNPSVTINVKYENKAKGWDDEWSAVGDWIYENWDDVCGITMFPYDNGHYLQAPRIEIEKKHYDMLTKIAPAQVNWSDLAKYDMGRDNTSQGKTAACVGGACEIQDLVIEEVPESTRMFVENSTDHLLHNSTSLGREGLSDSGSSGSNGRSKSPPYKKKRGADDNSSQQRNKDLRKTLTSNGIDVADSKI